MKNKSRTISHATLYPEDTEALKKEMDKLLADPARKQRVLNVLNYLKRQVGKSR